MDFGEENINNDNLDEEIEDMLINNVNSTEISNEEYMNMNNNEIYENNDEIKILENINTEYQHLLQNLKLKIIEALNSDRLKDDTQIESNSKSEMKNNSLFGKSFRKPYFILNNGDSFKPIIVDTNNKNSCKYSTEELTNRKWNEKEKIQLKKSVLKHQHQYMIENYINSMSNGSNGQSNSELYDLQLKMNNLKEMKIKTELLSQLNWNSISSDLENRDKNECYIYYHYNCDENINNNKWNEKEEILLMKLIDKYKGRNWLNISRELGTNRTPIECLKHYQV